MDKEQDKLEQLFKQRFENEELPIPEGMWERMRPSLPPPPPMAENKSDSDSNTAASKPWGKIIGSLVVATFLAGIVLFNVSKKQKNSLSEETSTLNNPSNTALSKRNTGKNIQPSTFENELEHYSTEKTTTENSNDFSSASSEETFTFSDTDKNNFTVSSEKTNVERSINSEKTPKLNTSKSNSTQPVLNNSVNQSRTIAQNNSNQEIISSLSPTSKSKEVKNNTSNSETTLKSETARSNSSSIVQHKGKTESNINVTVADSMSNSDLRQNDSTIHSESSQSFTSSISKLDTIDSSNKIAESGNQVLKNSTNTNNSSIDNIQEKTENAIQSTNSAALTPSKESLNRANPTNEETNSLATLTDTTGLGKKDSNSNILSEKSDSLLTVADSSKTDPTTVSEVTQSDSSAKKDNKEKQWRGRWIVEGNVGPIFNSKNTGAFTTNSGINYTNKGSLPGYGVDLAIHRTIKKNLMVGSGFTFQRNSMEYEANSIQTVIDTFSVDSSYYSYSQRFDTLLQQNVTDSTLVTVKLPRDSSYSLESTNSVKIIYNRFQLPLQFSYQWRSHNFGFYTTVNLLFTYTHYKYGAYTQSGNETGDKPTLPANKFSIGFGATSGMRYFLNQHFFVSGKISYQVNPSAHYPKNTFSIMGGAGFEF
jgi:hypothetical protein